MTAAGARYRLGNNLMKIAEPAMRNVLGIRRVLGLALLLVAVAAVAYLESAVAGDFDLRLVYFIIVLYGAMLLPRALALAIAAAVAIVSVGVVGATGTRLIVNGLTHRTKKTLEDVLLPQFYCGVQDVSEFLIAMIPTHSRYCLEVISPFFDKAADSTPLKKLVKGIGSDNIDFRLRQTDFALDGQIKPWLGMPIAEFAKLKRAFVIGSFLRKDHPLLATRLRAAVKGGAKLSVLHGADEDLLMTVAHKIIAAFQAPFQVEGHSLPATLSIGAALFPNDSTDQEMLLKNADAAMYRSKEAGRNCFRMFSAAGWPDSRP